jgi:hypothetical protein
LKAALMNLPHLAPKALLLIAACICTASSAQSPAAQREQFKKDNASRAEAPLPADLLAVAARVQTGRVPCELGHNVALLSDPAAPGYFTVTIGSQRFRMSPVATTTGAIRLEDKARGGVWLQLANKSMLLDEKNGRRLADECINPAQKTVADAMKAAPPTSILGALPGTVPNLAPLPQPEVSESAPAPSSANAPAK